MQYSATASSLLPPPGSACGQVPTMMKLEHRLIDKNWWETFAPYFAEFCGTFLITLTYLCNASAGDHLWAVTSNALMMAVSMYVFGHVSGGNLNPCISLALYLARRHTFWTLCYFSFFQIAGGSAAAILFHCFHQTDVNLGPKHGFSWWEASIVECLFTSMIVFVFLNCAASRGNNPVTSPNGFIGMAVGLCYVAGGYASLDVSGTVMNPAVAIGLQITDSSGNAHTSWGLEYLPMEILGALLAVSAYRLVRPKELDASLMFEPHDPLWQAQTSSRVMAEFIGTFYIVFTKALNNIGHSKAEAWSVAAAMGCMQYALRGVSGGHFNPAVSISAATSSRRLCTARNAVLYVGAQILGGMTASAMYGMVHHGGEIVIRPGKDYAHSTAAVIVGEMIFTCLSCYAVLATSAQRPALSKLRSNDIAGLAIGMCVAVGGFSVGDISGAVLNPAMALGFTGLNVIGGDMWQSTVVLYVFYEIIGGLLASGIFCLTHVSLLTEPEDEGAAERLGAPAPAATPLPMAKRLPAGGSRG